MRAPVVRRWFSVMSMPQLRPVFGRRWSSRTDDLHPYPLVDSGNSILHIPQRLWYSPMFYHGTQFALTVRMLAIRHFGDTVDCGVVIVIFCICSDCPTKNPRLRCRLWPKALPPWSSVCGWRALPLVGCPEQLRRHRHHPGTLVRLKLGNADYSCHH